MQAYEQLEVEFGKWNKLREGNVVACASGTAALHLALEAHRLPPSSEVICAEFNMVAVPRAISLAGLTPVFVDCDKDLLIEGNLLDEALAAREGRVKAILVTHIYGRICPMKEVHALARKYGVEVVIEDSAEAHGIPPHMESSAVCHSFFSNKIIAARDGEGGAVSFRERALADRARRLRCLGFTEAHDFYHEPFGHNYRLSNLHAQAILDSLVRVETNIFIRRELESIYDRYCPDEWKMPPREAAWVYDMRVPGLPVGKQYRIVQRLNEIGIRARYSFKSMAWLPEFQKCLSFRNGNSDRASVEVFYLPLTPGSMTEERIRVAFEVIKRIVSS